MSDDVLDREEVEDIAFVKLNGDLGRPPTKAARRLLAHDAALRAKLKRCRKLLEKSHELLGEEAMARGGDYVALRHRIREMLTELEADHERD